MKWRDANLSTLEKWHPCFHAIHPELMQVAQKVIQLFEQYLDCMKQSSDEPIDELLTHIEDEAFVYFINFVYSEMSKKRNLIASEN
jgi:hypothetical protein